MARGGSACSSLRFAVLLLLVAVLAEVGGAAAPFHGRLLRLCCCCCCCCCGGGGVQGQLSQQQAWQRNAEQDADGAASPSARWPCAPQQHTAAPEVCRCRQCPTAAPEGKCEPRGMQGKLGRAAACQGEST